MKSFKIPSEFSSQFIQDLKSFRTEQDRLKKDLSPSLLSFDNFNIKLSRHFGFCFGVQNAIEKIETIIADNPSKRLFLISEIIHNPKVNDALKEKGVQFIQTTSGQQLVDWKEIQKDDIVITPAFGTSTEINEILRSKGIDPAKYDTTCPFVERVWNKGEELISKGATIVIHGKANHEETRATFSRINGPCVIIETKKEAELLCQFINGEKNSIKEWQAEFGERTNDQFNFQSDLNELAVINQTTMLASETQEIANMIQVAAESKNKSFLSSRDTLCYATNDNQTATLKLIEEGFDLALVIGGEKSSNTNHLQELLSNAGKAFFIRDEDDILSLNEIEHFDIHLEKRVKESGYFPSKKHPTIAITAGASCPDATIEKVIQKLLSINNQNTDIQAAIDNYKNQFSGL